MALSAELVGGGALSPVDRDLLETVASLRSAALRCQTPAEADLFRRRLQLLATVAQDSADVAGSHAESLEQELDPVHRAELRERCAQPCVVELAGCLERVL